MRVGLEGVRALVEVRRVGLARVEVEVDGVAQRDPRVLVERLVVASQPVAHEAVDALGALEPVGIGLPVRDREQVVLAVLEVDLGPLGLVIDAVAAQQRRQVLPLGHRLVLRPGQTHVGQLVAAAALVDRLDRLGLGIALLVAEVLRGAGGQSGVLPGLGRGVDVLLLTDEGRVALEDHVLGGVRGVVLVAEGEGVAEVHARVLLAGLVVLAVRDEKLVLGAEPGEPHAALVSVDAPLGLHDPRVVGLGGRVVAVLTVVLVTTAAGGGVVEGHRGVEHADLVALHEAGRAGPLGLGREALVLEDRAGGAVGEDVPSVDPPAVGAARPVGRGGLRAGLAVEEAQARVGVAVVEGVASVTVGHQGEGDLPAVVGDLVGGLIGQRPGVPHPHVLARGREAVGDLRHRELLGHRVGARRRIGVGDALDLHGVGAGPLGGVVLLDPVRRTGVLGRIGPAGVVGLEALRVLGRGPTGGLLVALTRLALLRGALARLRLAGRRLVVLLGRSHLGRGLGSSGGGGGGAGGGRLIGERGGAGPGHQESERQRHGQSSATGAERSVCHGHCPYCPYS